MSKRVLFITAALIFLCSSAWAQLSTTSPWPKKHKNLKNTGETLTSAGTITGKLKWEFITQDAIKSSPVLDEPVSGKTPKIYFGSMDGNFYAVDRNTGKLAWKYTLSGSVEFCSPAIDTNGIIYIGDFAGTVYAFDTINIDPNTPSTWVPVWSYNVGGAIQSSITIDNTGAIIVASTNGNIYAFNPTTNPNGSLKWIAPYNYGSIYSSTPAIDGNLILIGSQSPQYRDSFLLTPDASAVTCPYINIFSAPTFFTLDSYNSGAEVSYFPAFCPPGGMFASPVVYNNGYYLLSFLKDTYGSLCSDNDLEIKNAEVWDVSLGVSDFNITRNYPTDNSCEDRYLPVYSAGGTGFPSTIWATPAVVNDNTAFIADGTRIARYLPGGEPYNNVVIDVGSRIESSPAVDRKLDVYFGSEGGIFYSICGKCSEVDTLINWTYPSDGTALKSQDGTRVVEIKSSPAIDNDAKHSVYVGANNGIMYAFFDGPAINGTIKRINGQPLVGVTVSIKNTETNVITTVLTNSNGYYETSGLDKGQYQVIPQLTNYVFNPSSPTVTIDTTDQTQDFTGSLSFRIIGKVVSTVDNTPLPNVSIKLVTKNSVGDVIYSDNSTQSDGEGNYVFTGIGYGTSTLTPSRPGYGFVPPSIDQTITTATTEGETFSVETFAGTLGYQVSGKVIDATKALDDPDNGLADVTVTITSSTFTDTRTTNPQGQYSFTGLEDGTYIVKPTRALYKFSPTNRTVVVDSASVLDQNFYGATGSTISGTLKLSGDETSFDGFVVNLYRDDETFWSRIFNRNKPRTLVATVDVGAEGSFIFMGVAAGKYIVEPVKDDYSFDPASEKVTMTGLNDIGSLVFTAVGGFSISGKTTNLIGIGESGIELTLVNDITGDTYRALSGLDGSYTFTGLESGSFTIIPEQTEFNTVSPASKNVIITTDSVRKVNFKVYSLCTKTFITIPFWGTTDSTVNIIGSFFGTTPNPDDTSTVDVTLYDGTTASVIPGVYFGTNDPASWVKATVDSWSPVYITAKVPVLDLRVVRVWVVRPGLSTCITNSPANFFINTNQ